MSTNETTILVEDDGSRRTIHVGGVLDLPNAATLQQAMADSLQPSSGEPRPTVVELSELTRIDLCGLQLLCSGHRTSVKRGGDLSLSGPPAWFDELCSAAGFAQSRSTCPNRTKNNCLWKA
jgi:anti-anti-sigma factor